MNSLAQIGCHRHRVLRLLQARPCYSRRRIQRLRQSLFEENSSQAQGTIPPKPPPTTGTGSNAIATTSARSTSDPTLLAEFRRRIKRNFVHGVRPVQAGSADYFYLRDRGLLTADDSVIIARELVIAALVRQRARHKGHDPADAAHIVIRDIQAGLLPLHAQASGYLIGVLRVSASLEDLSKYWNWLLDHGEPYCTAHTFGIMIEALTYLGAKLSVMEGMYKEAVERFCTPDSPPKSRVLVQGILAARLLNGNWRGAYELYDQYLRMHPQSTSRRFIERLFLYERPPNETAIICVISCRVGMPPAASLMRLVLHGIWVNHRDARAILNVATAYVGANGEIHASLILRLAISIMSSASDGPLVVPGKRYNEGYRFIYEELGRLLAVAGKRGFLFSDAKWVSLIYVSGEMKRRDMLEAVLQIMRDMKVGFGCQHLAAMRYSYSLLGDIRMVVESWKTLKRDFPDAVDQKRLTRSLTTCGLSKRDAKELRDSKLSSSDIFAATDKLLSNPMRVAAPSTTIRFSSPVIENPNLSVRQMREDIREALEKFNSALDNHGQPYEFAADPVFSTIPSKLPEGSSPRPIPTEELTAYYNTLGSMGKAKLGAVDNCTGYTEEHLHFENWRSINRALALAEANEEAERNAQRKVRMLDFSTDSLLLYVGGDTEELTWHRVTYASDRFQLEDQAKDRIRRRRTKEAEQDEKDEDDEEDIVTAHRRKTLAYRAQLGRQMGVENLVRDFGKVPHFAGGASDEVGDELF